MSGPPFLPLSPRDRGLSEPLSSEILLLDALLGEVLRDPGGAEWLRIAWELCNDCGDALSLLERKPELQRPGVLQPVLPAFVVLEKLQRLAAGPVERVQIRGRALRRR